MSTRIDLVPIDRLVCRPQVRERTGFGEEELTGLAQSIREAGILQPLLVRRKGDTLIVLDGERRLRAARMAGLTEVPVIVESEPLSEGDVLHRQLVLDAQRIGLSPLERGAAIQKLMSETRWCAREVAVKLGLSPASISKLLTLTVLPAEVQVAVTSGAVGMSTAYELAKLTDSAERQRLCQQAVNGGLTREDVIQRARELETQRASARRPARKARAARERVSIPLGEGRSVLVSAPSLSVESLIAWFTDLAERIRSAAGDGRPLAEVIKVISGNGK